MSRNLTVLTVRSSACVAYAQNCHHHDTVPILLGDPVRGAMLIVDLLSSIG